MMASAVDMLVSAVTSRPRTGRPTTVNTRAYRLLWRRGIEMAPTKWASPPPRMSWRVGLLIGAVQLLGLLCLMRYLGFYPRLPPSCLAVAAVLAGAALGASGRVREGRYISRSRAWLQADPEAMAFALDAAAVAARDVGQRLQAAGRHRAAHRAYLRAGARARRADRLRHR